MPKTSKLLRFVLPGLVVLPMAAQAGPVLWTLSANLTQGGVLAGTFQFDADTQLFSNIDINSTNTGNHYVSYFGPGSFITFGQAGVTSGTTVALWLRNLALSELTNAGGTIIKNFLPTALIAEVTCDVASCARGFGGFVTNYVGYQLVGTPQATVPVPGTLLLAGLGLVALASVKRR